MPSIDHNGARVAYVDSGCGETALLLHSSAGSGAQWRSLTEALRSRFRVLAPDLYGYGESDPWPGHGPLTLADEAALADAVTADHGPLHVIGHSYGGAVALSFALQRPERLRSLTLIEPVAFHLLRGAANRRLLVEIVKIAGVVADGAASGDYRGAMARFVDYWNGAGAWKRMKPEQQAGLARHTPKVALDFWATLIEPTSHSASYRQIAAPALILRGSESPAPTRRIAELLAGTLLAARLHTIEGAGHMLPLTHAAAVDAAVSAHLLHAIAGCRHPAAA
jgi:pimeloyl-ACP methyl ester carboxylesterase